MIIISKKATMGISSLAIAAILAIASLASIGIMQTGASAAPQATIFKDTIKDNFVTIFATTTTEEGITTDTVVTAYKDTRGQFGICVVLDQYDASGTSIEDFFGCSDADEITLTGFSSATLSGTVTSFDGTQQVTVSADLTGTGKVYTQSDVVVDRFDTPSFTVVQQYNGKLRSVSGSLDISGDISLSTDHATGDIGTTRIGTIEVQVH